MGQFIKLGSLRGGKQGHRRGGTHSCEEGNYHSFALTKFDDFDGVLFGQAEYSHVMLKQEVQFGFHQCLDES